MDVSSPTPRRTLVWLALLTLGALGLRLTGIDCGLPHHVEPDSMIVKNAAWFVRPAGVGEGLLCAPDTFYPRFLAWLIAVLPGRSYPTVPPLDAGLAAHLAALAVPYLKARIVIAGLSLLAVPATFGIARRFLDARWALLAAAFAATSLLATNYAQQARPHAAMAGLMSLGLVLVLRLLDRPSWANYALAGLGAGLALAGLHNGACVVLALCAAHWLAQGRSWPRFALACAVCLACALPAWWEILARGLAPGERGGVNIGGQEINTTLFSGRGFPEIARYLWGYEPLMCLLALALIGAWGLRRVRVGAGARPLLVLAACWLPFVLVFGSRNIVESRFFVPFVPVLALLAAGGLRALGLSPWLAALALLPQTYASVKLVALRSQGETLATAAHWLEQHADREHDAIGVQPTFSLPLFARRAGLERLPALFRNPWELYQLALPAEPAGAWDLRYIAREEWWANRRGPDGRIVYGREADVLEFAHAEHLAYGLGVVPTGKGTDRNEILEGLHKAGQPALVLHPIDPVDAEVSSSAYEMGYYAFLRVLRARCWGHPVEIVRVK